MRKLIVFALVAATLYGGYWFVGRSQIQERLALALEEADAGAYDVSYDSLKTRGFPSRFDTTITEFEFTDPATGTHWSAPFFQLLALSYRPNEVIAIFPPQQMFSVAGSDVTLLTDDMRASGKVRANAALSFMDATVTMDNPRFQMADGAELAMANLLAATRLTPDTEASYDVFLEANTIALPQVLRGQIDPGFLQPEFIQNLRFDSVATLSAPVAFNSPDPSPTAFETLTIKELALSWGEISFSAIGDLTTGLEGLPSGSITVSARNWQTAIELALANGMLEENRRFLVTEIIRNLDETPHIQDTLTLTLSITDGRVSLGGLPIGTLPALR